VIRTPGDLCKPLGTASTPMKDDTCVFDLPVRKQFTEATACGLKEQHRPIVAESYLQNKDKIQNSFLKYSKEERECSITLQNTVK